MKREFIIAAVIAALAIFGSVFYAYQREKYPYSGNAGTITEYDLKCGSYWGFQDQKKMGTPDDWVWSEAGLSSSWHRPENYSPPGTCAANP